MEIPTCKTPGSLARPVLYLFLGTCRFRLVPRWLFWRRQPNLPLMTSSTPSRDILVVPLHSLLLDCLLMNIQFECHKFLDSHNV